MAPIAAANIEITKLTQILGGWFLVSVRPLKQDGDLIGSLACVAGFSVLSFLGTWPGVWGVLAGGLGLVLLLAVLFLPCCMISIKINFLIGLEQKAMKKRQSIQKI